MFSLSSQVLRGGSLSTLLLVMTGFGLLSSESRAQVLYGTLVGQVRDQSGAAIPGADVTVVHEGTNLTRHTSSSDAGLYTFPTLSAGNYTVKVSMPGFKQSVRTGVPVTANSTMRVEMVLEVGELAEAVTVSAQTTPVLQTDRAEVRAEVSEKELANLPIPSGRNYQELFRTLPGFVVGDPPRASATNPSNSLLFTVNGASASLNNTRLDGASAANVWQPHLTAYVPALEAIEMVDVVTNSFDAEQGLAGGAAINVRTKSGSNEFRGSLFHYHHNHLLGARNFFLPPDQGRQKYLFNQWGGTLGGPIKKDRLFFFASYEGTSDRQSASRIVSVPSQAVRRGDFSSFSTIIYDPATGKPDGSGRIPFAGNRIPSQRIDPIVQKILDRVPLPNLPGRENLETNNYFVSAPFAFDRWTIDTKLDWVLSQEFNLFARYSMLDFLMDSPTVFGTALEGRGLTGRGISSPGNSFGNTYNLAFGMNSVLKPNLIVDANFGFVRMDTNAEHWSIKENVGLDLLGIPGTNGPASFQKGWPYFGVSGYEAYGTNLHYYPYYRSDDQFQYVTNFSWTKSSHEIRWGMDLYGQHMNHLQPEFTGGASRGPRGRFDFGTGPTRLCRQPDGRGGCRSLSPSVANVNSFATFLLGLPTQLGKNLLTVAPYTTRNWGYSFYLRDRWQLTPKLTFSYGTRWEYFPIPTREDRGLERYDPEINKMLIGGVGSIPKNLGVEVSRSLFAPRLGLAYRVSEKLVVRAGYGLTNDPYALARPLRTNHPILIELDVRAPNTWTPAGRLADGIPPIPVPSLGNGVIDIPGNVTAFTIPSRFDRGYVQSWNLTLQRELDSGFVGEVGYVATRQIRSLGFQELNWAPIGGGSVGQQLFQKFRRTANTRVVAPIGGSNYDSLQAQLKRRFADGYSVHVAYTWSKAMSDTGTSRSDQTLPISIPEYYHLNRSVTDFDRTHNLQIANILELPFGAGRRWVADRGFLSSVLGGWQVSNILSFISGRPFNVTASSASLNAPGSSQRADQVKDKVKILGGVGPGQPYFDTTAFAPVNEARFGTASFRALRGPGEANWNFGLFRRFQVSEEVNVEFRAEAFNFTNTPQFGNPNGDVSSSAFGDITSAQGEREFRFGLRVGF